MADRITELVLLHIEEGVLPVHGEWSLAAACDAEAWTWDARSQVPAPYGVDQTAATEGCLVIAYEYECLCDALDLGNYNDNLS